ncbi:MAG: DUF2889 domain-containing protein [Burkholderiales bacterium]|nr:DUF2889 domain-containing protein [Burkholderiales bacterium]
MPLTPPVGRKPMHTRTVTCRGYLREDGAWDIEGHLVDTKPYDIPGEDRGGTIAAGAHLHDMWIRLTVDTDLNVLDAQAVIDNGPYGICGDIAPAFSRLKGLSIRSGWSRRTRELLGGTRGCTHLLELLGPMATTAFQTVYAARVELDQARGATQRPGLINGCHAYADDGPIVLRRWPQFSKRA